MAVEAASIRARRIDTAATSEQVQGRAGARTVASAVLTEQSNPSLNSTIANLLGETASGSISSSLSAESASVATDQLAIVNEAAGDGAAVLEETGSTVPVGDMPLLLAIILATYMDHPGDWMVMTDSPSSHSAVGSGDAAGVSGGVVQKHSTATVPQLLSTALATIGFQRADADSIGEAALVLLGLSTVDDIGVADSPATAFAVADIGAIHELAAAILAAAYVDASYLDSVVETASRAIAGDGFPLAEGVATDQAAFVAAVVEEATSGRISGRYGDLERLSETTIAMLGSKSADERTALAVLVADAFRATNGTSLDDQTRVLARVGTGDAIGAIDVAGQGVLLRSTDFLMLAEQLASVMAAFDRAGIAEAAVGTPGFRAPSDAALGAALSARLVLQGPSDEASIAHAWRQMVGTGHVDIEPIAAALAMALAPIDVASLAGAAATAPAFRKPVVTELMEAIRAQTFDGSASRTTLRVRAGAAATRGNAVPLGIADLWAASVVTAETSSFVVPGFQARAYANRDASAITASLYARIRRQRVETARIGAAVEVRTTRGPSVAPQIHAIATTGIVRRGAEPLGILAVATLAARQNDVDLPRITEAVSFVLTGAPSTTTLAKEGPDKGSPVAGLPGAARAGETTAAMIVGGQAGSGTQREDTESVTIVPPPPARSPATRGQVVSVVWPTRAATLVVPEHGVTLNVPAGARSTVFQTRVAVESPESLELPPAGDVLRVVRIEIFDALGRPVVDPAPEKPMDLIIHLETLDLERLSGGKPNRQAQSGLITLQRFDPQAPEPVWREIPVREVGDDAVAATLDHLSLFALVAKRVEADVSIIQEQHQRHDGRAPLMVILAAAGVAFGGLVVLQAATSVTRRRRGPPDNG